MSHAEAHVSLTSALEDYLESIYQLIREKSFARIKDIAEARGVRSASVSPAMRRLDEMGLITYRHREYISLTPSGEREARRIYAKHQILTRFFEEILRMSRKAAVENACAMEHSLTPEGMDHMVRLLEFLRACPEGRELLDRFHTCSLVHEDIKTCVHRGACQADGRDRHSGACNLAEVAPGTEVRVIQVVGDPTLRQQVLDKGLLPDAVVRVSRLELGKLLVRSQGFRLTLSLDEAGAVHVVPVE